jgi:hypothetical protein
MYNLEKWKIRTRPGRVGGTGLSKGRLQPSPLAARFLHNTKSEKTTTMSKGF